MRIGIISQFYAPEPGPAQLPTALAECLQQRGHQVRVVTGFPNYPLGELAGGYTLHRKQDEERGGALVRRVYLHPDHGSARGRAANYASFGASSVVNGLNFLRGAEALWVNASPITLAWPIWAARALGIPTVSHILDLWPESLYGTGFGDRLSGPIANRLLHAWTNSIYRGSDKVAYISPSVGDLLQRRGVPRDKLHYIPMWADEQVFRPHGHSMRRELNIPSDAIVVTYAGALGRAQGILPLIDACSMVDDPRFVCIIAGSGVEEDAVRDVAGRTPRVRFKVGS